MIILLRALSSVLAIAVIIAAFRGRRSSRPLFLLWLLYAVLPYAAWFAATGKADFSMGANAWWTAAISVAAAAEASWTVLPGRRERIWTGITVAALAILAVWLFAMTDPGRQRAYVTEYYLLTGEGIAGIAMGVPAMVAGWGRVPRRNLLHLGLMLIWFAAAVAVNERYRFVSDDAPAVMRLMAGNDIVDMGCCVGWWWVWGGKV